MPVLPFSDNSSSSSGGDTSSDEESDTKRARNKTNVIFPAEISSNSKMVVGFERGENSAASTSSKQRQESADLFLIDTSTSDKNMTVQPIDNKRLDWKTKRSALTAGDLFSVFNEKFYKSINRKEIESNSRVEEAMKKSVINEEFSKKDAVPPYVESHRAAKKKRQIEKEKTKGKSWYDFPATELTEERKRDLEIMQIRDSLDPKQFYRREDRKVLPKYFQIGTVIEDPSDYYTDRIPKKQRKQTIVDEILADAELQQYSKRKYKEIVAEKYKNQTKKRFFKRKEKPEKKKSKKIDETYENINKIKNELN